MNWSLQGTAGLACPLKRKKAPTVTGIFRAHKNGFGFVTVDEEEDDLVGRNDVNHAIEGDTVEVIIKKVADRMKGTAAEAKVIDILKHALTSAVGLLILDEEKPKYAGYIKSKKPENQPADLCQKISNPSGWNRDYQGGY